MKSNVDPAYIDKNLRNGAFVEISCPRPKPVDRPQRLKLRHQHIEHEAAAACDLVTTPGAIVVPAVDTNNRLMIVQMEPPQAPLRPGPAPSAFEFQKSSAKSARDKANLYLDIVTQLNNGTICTYRDMAKACGDEQLVNSTIRAIRRFESTPTSLQTVDGVVDLHLDKILHAILPDDTEVVCEAAFRGMEAERGDIWVYLRLDATALQPLTNGSGPKVRKVCLYVENKIRALKLFQGLAFFDAEAKVAIGRAFDLRSLKWRLTVKGFEDEAQVIKSLGLLGKMIPT